MQIEFIAGALNDVQRILTDGLIEMTGQGKLKHQRKG